MSEISRIDKNFHVATTISREGLVFRNAAEAPFRIYGLLRTPERYCRVPEEIAANVNDGVHRLAKNTAGGRVRFVTNSPYVAIAAEMDGLGKMPHFPLTGSIGFDLYVGIGSQQIYRGTFTPPFNITDGYESVIDLGAEEERIITINFPLYSNVKQLYIGLKDGCMLSAAPDYRVEKPIVYYGSSITQGGCASRPGNAYQAIISRRQDSNFINLGFSGSARGEQVIIDYINQLDMSLFVLDYDHNAPTPEHLEATHEHMYQCIRAAHPDLPIIMLSRPKVHLTPESIRRLEIVTKTYNNAVAAGDTRVYLIPGSELIEPDAIECATVDNCHPNDAGFLSIANVLGKLIEQLV